MIPRRVLIVDDEPKILEVVQSYLAHAGYEVLCAGTGRAALEIFEREHVDMMILDLMLPDIRGEEVCGTVRRRSSLPILMLTAKVDEDSLVHGFHLGADDYLTKPFSPRELMVRVEALFKRSDNTGAKEVTKTVSADGRFGIDITACLATKDGRELDLTATEYQLFRLFMENPGRVFSREDLVRLVLGENFEGDARTVDAHIKNLRHKIEDEGKLPRFVLTVHGMGYRFYQGHS